MTYHSFYFPNDKGSWTNLVFTVEQAVVAFREALTFQPTVVLCVDVPRARYCSTLVEATEFFTGEPTEPRIEHIEIRNVILEGRKK